MDKRPGWDSNPRPSPWQGDTPPLSHSCIDIMKYTLKTAHIILQIPMKAGLLLPAPIFAFLRSSDRPISNSQLHTSLYFHLCPIYLVVSKGPPTLKVWKSHLGVGFTLRCLQRLSLPVLATRPCHWHDNRSTSGRSIPVLSY